MGPRRAVVCSLLALCAAAAPARAEPANASAPSGPGGAPRTAAKAVRPVVQARERIAEAAPPSPVHLSIEARTTRGPFRMRVKNDGDVPVRIVADARLLSLDLSPRSARAPTRCELPADMRPEGDVGGRALVLPAGASYSESFEPRLYCIGGSKLDALAPGAILVAHLGWPPARAGAKPSAPFVVSPVDGVEPAPAPQKSIEAPPIALPDEPSAWAADAAPSELAAPFAPRLSLTGPRAIDAEMPSDIAISLTLHNEGTRDVLVRFRPEALSFELVGPAGVETCRWPVMPSAALKEVFSTLPGSGSLELSVTLASYCTGHGLDDAGLLVVRPRLDTRRSSGASVGLRAFEGEVIAVTPTLVRLHRGAAPPTLQQPLLDP